MGPPETGEAGGGVFRGGCGLPPALECGHPALQGLASPGCRRMRMWRGCARGLPGGPGGEGSATDRHRGRGGGAAGSGPDPNVIAEA